MVLWTISALFAGILLGAAGASAETTMVGVYDPTGQSPRQIQWAPYPADPPAGFHWQQTGSLAIQLDPATGQPLPGQITSHWILVRDGFRMPQIRRGSGKQ